jgi:hypothetical protein
MAVCEATNLTSSSFAHSSAREREDDSRDLDRDGALARACKLSGSRLRLNADIRLSKPPMACTLAKLTLRSWSTYGSTIWRESRDQQRLPPDVEIGAANCFVPIDVNCPILRSWGSERPTYTVQARRKTRGRARHQASSRPHSLGWHGYDPVRSRLPPLVPFSKPSITGARARRIATSGDRLAPATPSLTSAPFRRPAPNGFGFTECGRRSSKPWYS